MYTCNSRYTLTLEDNPMDPENHWLEENTQHQGARSSGSMLVDSASGSLLPSDVALSPSKATAAAEHFRPLTSRTVFQRSVTPWKRSTWNLKTAPGL